MTQPPRTRYALSGDAHIAYQVFGENLDLVFVPSRNIEHYWEMPRFPTCSSGSLVCARRDLRQAWHRAGPRERPTPAGAADGRYAGADGCRRRGAGGPLRDLGGGPGQPLFAATYPERASSLVLTGLDPTLPYAPTSWGATDEQIELMLSQTEHTWGDAPAGHLRPHSRRGSRHAAGMGPVPARECQRRWRGR